MADRGADGSSHGATSRGPTRQNHQDRNRGSGKTDCVGPAASARGSDAVSQGFESQIQSVRPKIAPLRIHRPFVKSGILTGRLPVAIERSESGEIAIQLAVS